MAKLVIGLVGPIASGKDTVKKYLVEKYGATDVRFSTILRDVLTRVDVPHTRANVQKISTVLRDAFGQDLLAKVIAADIKKKTSAIVVADGVRRPEDIEYAKQLPGFMLLAVDAQPNLRYERLVKRNENVGDSEKTYEQFLKDHEYETELQIPALMKSAVRIFDNNGTFEDLYRQIDEVVAPRFS